MIGQYLLHKNESVIVSKSKKNWIHTKLSEEVGAEKDKTSEWRSASHVSPKVKPRVGRPTYTPHY